MCFLGRSFGPILWTHRAEEGNLKGNRPIIKVAKDPNEKLENSLAGHTTYGFKSLKASGLGILQCKV